MTIISGIEIDNIAYMQNDIKEAIKKNKPIEEKLHMVICVSNAIQFASRYILARNFINRIENEESNVILYIVELAYDLPNKKPQKFYITDSNNPRHLQLRTSIPLWHKENLLNIGIQKLLPKNWKAVCWADADIIWDDPNFAINTLKVLNGCRDIIQNFSHCVDMDPNGNAMSIFSGFGYQYLHNRPYQKGGNPNNQFHPGYSWSCTRRAYEQMGGLYEYAILGAGDHHMSLCWVFNGIKSISESANKSYIHSILDFQEKCKGLKIGYIPGTISHEFHGYKQKRGYNERWNILINNNYSPLEHITHDINGILIPTKDCSKNFLKEIYMYFESRQEDEALISTFTQISLNN